MAFVKAFAGALGGAFADQWLDFFTIPDGLSATVGLCKAVRTHMNMDRSSNTKSSDCVITDGSLIVVPEGYSLVTLENGRVTGLVSEPGGYRWQSDDPNSKTFFNGGSLVENVAVQLGERFKFGGTPGVSQIALFVNQKEIPNNKFGTQSTIYWDDAYLNAQAGARARGSYSFRIVDPVLFLQKMVPAEFFSPEASITPFDFADFDNAVSSQLFNEVVGSLSATFSAYANMDAAMKPNRISRLQSDAVGFAHSLAQILETNYKWREHHGLQITSATLMAVEYDQATQQLLSQVQRADALMGARGSANLQASLAEGLQSAGKSPDGGATGMAFMGMAMNTMVSGVMSQQMGFGQSPVAPQPASMEDPYERLAKLKGLLDKGVITLEEFDAAKKKVLGM